MFNEQVFLGGCPVIQPEGIYLNGVRVIRLGLSGVERRNPLPTGRYWIDVFASKEAAFQSWLQAHKAALRVVATETFEPVGGYEGRVWRLFDVVAPVPWEGPGLPTTASPEIKSSSDTAQRPAPEKDLLDQIDVPLYFDRAKTTFWIVGAVVVVAIGGAIIYYMPRRREAPPSLYPSPSYGRST